MSMSAYDKMTFESFEKILNEQFNSSPDKLAVDSIEAYSGIGGIRVIFNVCDAKGYRPYVFFDGRVDKFVEFLQVWEEDCIKDNYVIDDQRIVECIFKSLFNFKWEDWREYLAFKIKMYKKLLVSYPFLEKTYLELGLLPVLHSL